jgi:hypothetical protein
MMFPNPWEVEDEPSDPLPRDKDGKTIVPTQAFLLEQLATLRKANEERQRQLAHDQWMDRFRAQR